MGTWPDAKLFYGIDLGTETDLYTDHTLEKRRKGSEKQIKGGTGCLCPGA